MAQLITPGPGATDTPKIIEDKTRALPANQGVNDYDMWVLIDTEVASARSANRINENELHPVAGTNNRHGKK